VNDSRRGLLQSLLATPALAAAGIKNVEGKEVAVPKAGRTLLVFKFTAPATLDAHEHLSGKVRAMLDDAGLVDVPAILLPHCVDVQPVSLTEWE